MLKLVGEKIVNKMIEQLARTAGGTQKYVPKPGVWQFFDDELEEFVKLVIKEASSAALKPCTVSTTTEAANSSTVVFNFDAYRNIMSHFDMLKGK